MITSRLLFISLLTAAAFTMACESQEQDVPEESAPVIEEPAEDETVEEAEEDAAAPRMAPTEAPEDEMIGVLPEGIGVAVGEEIENFTLTDSDGEEVELEALLGESPVMLVFYRGGWCPFCNFQIRELTTAYSEFEDRGILPVAISVDQVEEAAKSDETYDIPFPVLSDQDLVAHNAFQVVQKVDAEEVERLNEMGMDLEASSGRDHHTIAIASIFVIDQEGVVRWAHANEDYRVRPSLDQLVAAIDGMENL